MRAILQEIYFITKPQDFMVHDLSTSRRLHLRIDLKLTRFGRRLIPDFEELDLGDPLSSSKMLC